MSARILIMDPVATNRIVLRVKLGRAQFACDACETPQEAARAMARARPDIVVINPTYDAKAAYDFCRNLRSDPKNRSVGIIAIGVADTATARCSAIDSGADDAIPHPVNDAYLMARIRCLLRVRRARHDLGLNPDTIAALGFEEARQSFVAPPVVHYVSDDKLAPPDAVAAAQAAPAQGLVRMSYQTALEQPVEVAPPDAIILDLRSDNAVGPDVARLLPELKARTASRQVPIIVINDPDTWTTAATQLDLGAEEVVDAQVSAKEFQIRCARMIARKRERDSQDNHVMTSLEAAVRDPLTGLFNRRFAMPHLSQLEADATKRGQTLAVLMIDVDFFKAINDQHGHGVGDQVLTELGRRMRANLRAVDLVSRIGGEEFMIALPNTTAIQARRAANRLRKLICDMPFMVRTGAASINVSISVGIALSTPEHPIPLRERADAALYRAKHNGRNQVAFAKSAA